MGSLTPTQAPYGTPPFFREELVPVGEKIDRVRWYTFRHSYRSLLDVCAQIGVQQKLSAMLR